MVKGSNSLRNKKLHSSKPYDVSNSFVKKVTSHVTNLLPQPTWLSKWFTSSVDDEGNKRDALNANDSGSEEEDDSNARPPPSKRAKIPLNQKFPANSFIVSPILNEAAPNQVAGPSRIVPGDIISDGAVAGPSGINTRPQLISSTPNVQPTASNLLNSADRKLNGDDRSDSSESTSGCSSLVPQANRQFQANVTATNSMSVRQRSIDEKLNYTGHLQSPRSLFSDRSLSRSPGLNASFSRRRKPSFNVSTFGSPVLAKDKFSIQNRIVNSPFYSGRTTYGGAAAYRRTKDGFPLPNETATVKRCGVQVKHVNCESDSLSSMTMSTTAKRILEALEQFSSPVLDAKRIPVQPATPPLSSSKRKRPVESSPSLGGLRIGQSPRTPNAARPLTVPTVPDLLKLKHREKLQDTMESARLIAVSSAEISSPPSTNIPDVGYRLRFEESEKSGKHGGKIKSKEKELEEETVQEVKLPNISLPVTSLPKFDFVVPPASNNPPVSSTYKFASPITVTQNVRTCKPVDNFTFSNPLSIGSKDINHQAKKVNCVDTSIPNSSNQLSELQFKSGSDNKLVSEKEHSKNVFRKNNSQSSEVCFGIKPAAELKSGSVMDILGKLSNSIDKEDSKEVSSSSSISLDKFKPDPGMWECSTCMIRNKSDAVKCVCCGSPHTTISTQSLPAFNSNSWECSSCHASNTLSSVSCSKCSVAKSGLKSQNKESSLKQEKPLSSMTGFGNKFKPPSGTWECSTCLVRNPEALTKCQACETKCPGMTDKPSPTPVTLSAKPLSGVGFGDKFKKPEGSWECPDCMVSNKSDSLKCIACERAKPGTETKTPSTKFNITIPAEANTFKFGIDKAGDTVKEPVFPASSTQGFKFGETKATSVPNFTFGVKSSVSDSTKLDTGTVTTAVITPTFNYGISALSSTSSNSTIIKPADTGTVTQSLFSFGASQPSKVQSISKEDKQPVEVPKKRRASDAIDGKASPSEEVKESSILIKFPVVSLETSSDANKLVLKPESKDQPAKKVSFSLSPSSGPSVFTNEKPNTSTKNAENAKPSFSFGASSAGLTFDSGKAAPFSFTGSSATGSVFGGSTTVTTTVASSSTSGTSVATTTIAAAAVTTTVSSSSSNPFSFGSTKSPTAFGSVSSGLSFGQNPASTSVATPTFGVGLKTTSPASTFTFTSQAKPFGGTSKEPSIVSTSNTQSSTFGTVTSTTAVTAFGTSTTTTTTTTTTAAAAVAITASSITSPSLSSFGTATSTPNFSLGSKSSIPAFGTSTTTSTTASTTTAASTFVTPNFSTGFSALTDQNKSSKSISTPAPFTFGASANNTTSSLGTTAPFTFGNLQNESGLASKGTFSFGAPSGNNPLTSGSTPAANSGFGFVSTNPAPFSFGANTSSTPNSTPSLFGSAANNASASTSGLVFGAASTPSFGTNNPSGSSSNSTNFATSTFNFGANATQPNSNVFGFTANQASGSTGTPGQSFAATTPNFNYGQAQTSAQTPAQPTPPTFNPNMRPSFNFTRGETPEFTAAGSAAPGPRRIKKAVRRTHTRT